MNPKKGDVVKLAAGEGIFIDHETGLEVFNSETAKIGETVGQATRLALQSGGLLLVQAEKKTSAKDPATPKTPAKTKTEKDPAKPETDPEENTGENGDGADGADAKE